MTSLTGSGKLVNTKEIYTGQGVRITVEQELGKGGEGSVYALRGDANHVLKLAHSPLDPEQSAKITAMVQRGTDRLKRLTAWPLETAHDKPGGVMIGFLMPRATGKSIHTLYGPKSRLVHFPEADWRFLIHVAGNIARAVHAVHEHGIVIGDINHGNIFVAPNGTVTLIDTDSFQLQVNGKLKLCGVGIETHTPPELQGANFRITPRTPDHDNFGLAVLVFQLLFLGRHPFVGRPLHGEINLSDAIKQRLFAYGTDAKSRGVIPPPSTLPLDASSAFLAQLFGRAFLAKGQPRPTATEWVGGLEALQKGLRGCTTHSGHYFVSSLPRCPWCEIESQSKTFLFPFASGVIASTGGFRLDEFWKHVVALPVVPSLGLISLEPLPNVEVSRWAQEQRQAYGNGVQSWLAKVGLNTKRREAQRQGKERLESAQRDWQGLVKQWEAENSRTQITELSGQMHDWRTQHQNLPTLRQQRLNKIQSDLRQTQLYRFLDSQRIHNATITGIGPVRKTKLQSYGIETAADITAVAVMGIPGFGGGITEILLEWRKNVERHFVFDPNRAVDPHDLQKLEREIGQERVALERRLTEGLQKLRAIGANAGHLQQSLRDRAESLRHAVAQATIDFRSL